MKRPRFTPTTPTATLCAPSSGRRKVLFIADSMREATRIRNRCLLVADESNKLQIKQVLRTQ